MEIIFVGFKFVGEGISKNKVLQFIFINVPTDLHE